METVKKNQPEKKVEVKKHTNHQQRLENIVKQTVVESKVKHLFQLVVISDLSSVVKSYIHC